MIDINSLNNAIVLTQKGEFEKAEAIYLKLLQEEPDNYILLSSLGLFYVNINNFGKAISYLEKAYSINATLGTVSALGFAQFEQNEFEKSAQTLEKALELGENPDVYHKLILSLFHIKNYPKAVDFAEKMYKLYPENPKAVASMVKAYTQTGKLMEAEKLCVEYLREHQNTASLWFHLGFLKELIYSDDKQAAECYRIASELGQDEALYNLAVSFQKQGDFQKAKDYYKKMLEIYPNDIETLTSLGMCYLTQKRFEEGYKLFFNRKTPVLKKHTKNPYKIGSRLEKEIVIICDQGFGDHIQFIRYLPFLKEKVCSFKVACPPALKNLFQKNYPDFEFINYSEINPETQAVRITDLAFILGMDFDNIPFAEGYLNCESKKIPSSKLKIGLCWEAGSAGIRTMINRTINVRLLEPIINYSNAEIFSFQVTDSMNGNKKYPQMINLAKDFKDFEDTAKAMKNMDIIITVDTSVAHLAGALGIKTYLLLPYSSDWRWFSDTKTTPWYNSIEIFKQNDPISWEKPIEEILCKLKEFSL